MVHVVIPNASFQNTQISTFRFPKFGSCFIKVGNNALILTFTNLNSTPEECIPDPGLRGDYTYHSGNICSGNVHSGKRRSALNCCKTSYKGEWYISLILLRISFFCGTHFNDRQVCIFTALENTLLLNCVNMFSSTKNR